MTTDQYRSALDAAVREYEKLGEQRREIDERLAQLAQTIGTLNRLCGLVPTVFWGLTDACRVVLKGVGRPMAPMEVRDRLLAIGFDLSKYANSLAAIHTVLKRLAEAGELRSVALDGGQGLLRVAAGRPTRARDERSRAGQHRPRRHRPSTDDVLEKEETEKEMIDMLDRRRFFAEELEAVCKLRSPALVDAFATVPREQFLPPGPWTVMADSDFMAGMRLRATPDADPARIYHNISVAIDPTRQLFNGQPGTLGVWIDALDLGPGRTRAARRMRPRLLHGRDGALRRADRPRGGVRGRRDAGGGGAAESGVALVGRRESRRRLVERSTRRSTRCSSMPA